MTLFERFFSMYKFILAAALLSGCTDAIFSRFTTLGKSAEVKSYNGSKLIFHGISTGQIANEENSDGFRGKFKIKVLEGQWDTVKVGETRVVSISVGTVIIYEN